MSPGREREEEGWLHVSFPHLSLECGAVKRESIAVPPQNKGAVHWLSYLLCIGILCWASYPLHRGQEPPYKESNGWAILPQTKEELPNLSEGPR